MLEQFRAMASNAGMPEVAEVWLRPERSDTLDDAGMGALHRFIESPQFNRDIVFGEWAVISLAQGDVDALLSDNPVVHLGDLKENAFILMLPLAPRTLFVCASTPEDLVRTTTNVSCKLFKAVNRQMVKQATEYVYATGRFHEPLVRKWLVHTAARNGDV